MARIFICIFLLMLLVVASCSNSESFCDGSTPAATERIVQDSTSEEDSLEVDPMETFAPENMILVPGSSDTIVLGSNAVSAKLSEKPEMKVLLDYDYFLDAHETTCGDYVSLMKEYGAKESFAQSFKCAKDSLPIVNVTYFDAILFANAKSIADSVDTVYSYVKALFDESGHCTDLSGFVFHAERKGYRLPTEAEWVKAAASGFDVQASWNNENSGFESHEVCSQKVNKLGFCDLLGNVMEWVNDWLGRFRDTTITNYVGAPDGGSLGERVIKGGAFNTDPFNINTYSRGDVYTVISSTKSNYVGFRLAVGAIPNAIWMGADGTAKSSIVNILASSTDIYSYTKSYNVKLAFRNDETGNLAFVDYANGAQSVVEVQDTIDVYHPEISPDGNKVAFCTKLEGVAGNSALYVRNLDANGSGLVKLDVPSAAIPRWRVLENGDTVITYVTNAGSNQNETTWKKYSTWQVPFVGGNFGVSQKILDGAFHGGISRDGRLAVTGAQLLRTRMDSKDSLWYNGEQACNVSMTQDGSKRTAFLDFGGKTGQAYVGRRYGVHENLLIADSTGKLIQYVTAPSGYTFDHSEWAVGNVMENIVATLTNLDGAHKKIVLVNLAAEVSLELAEGNELWHPSLWIKGRTSGVAYSSKNEEVSSSSAVVESSDDVAVESSDGFAIESSGNVDIESSSDIEVSSSSIADYEFDPDSAGMYYNNSGASSSALYYRYKMEFLWQYKDSANVVIAGSSRSYYGVMPLQFKKPRIAVNLAVPTGVMRGNKYLLGNYVIPHYKHLKAIVISLDLDRSDDLGLAEYNLFYTAYESYSGYVYDKNHDFWKGYDTKKLYDATYNTLGSSELASLLRPTAGYPSGSGYSSWGNPFVQNDSNFISAKSSVFETNFNMLKDLAKTCYEHNIILVGVIFPLNPRYRETGAYGRHGLRRSEAPAIIERLQGLSLSYPNFILFDENKMGNHDYTDEMARDTDHLGDLGATQMSLRLDSLLQNQDINWEE